jgi:multiple sugar transport system ATP-binding protein
VPGVRPGQAVIVGVRPEDLTPCAPGTPGALTADVRAVERLGSALHAFFSLDAPPAGGPVAGGTAGPGPAPAVETEAGLPGLAHNGVARLDPRVEVRPGGRITLRVDPGRLYFFDPASGDAIAWPAPQEEPAGDVPHPAVRT